MKDILKGLARLAIMVAIITIAFFGSMGFVALMLIGLEWLPQYIGGFGTLMFYVAVFMVMFAGIKYFTRNKHYSKR